MSERSPTLPHLGIILPNDPIKLRAREPSESSRRNERRLGSAPRRPAVDVVHYRARRPVLRIMRRVLDWMEPVG